MFAINLKNNDQDNKIFERMRSQFLIETIIFFFLILIDQINNFMLIERNIESIHLKKPIQKI